MVVLEALVIAVASMGEMRQENLSYIRAHTESYSQTTPPYDPRGHEHIPDKAIREEKRLYFGHKKHD